MLMYRASQLCPTAVILALSVCCCYDSPPSLRVFNILNIVAVISVSFSLYFICFFYVEIF